MKKINQKEIDAIIQSFYDINAPVKLYAGIKELLEKLPDCPCEVEKTLDK